MTATVDERRAVGAMLRAAAPIVTVPEIQRLRTRLAAAARGEAFVLHVAHLGGGEDVVRQRLRLLYAVTTVVAYAVARPVVVVAYAGDAGPVRRGTDAADVMRAYADAAGVMNLLRALHPEQTDRPDGLFDAVPGSTDLVRGLRFVTSTGHAGPVARELYVSHDGALLDFERGLLRYPSGEPGGLYACSAHLLWTRPGDGELGRIAAGFAGLIANPVGLVADADDAERLAARLARLDPDGKSGRVVVRLRPGSRGVSGLLPRIVEATGRAGVEVVWLCDGAGTAPLDELTGFLAVHRALGTHPGGIHLDLRALSAPDGIDLALRLGDVLHKG